MSNNNETTIVDAGKDPNAGLGGSYRIDDATQTRVLVTRTTDGEDGSQISTPGLRPSAPS